MTRRPSMPVDPIVVPRDLSAHGIDRERIRYRVLVVSVAALVALAVFAIGFFAGRWSA